MSSRLGVIYSVAILLSIAGIATSLYISYSRSSLPSFCEIGSEFSCSEVLSSQYSSFFGISMEYYGAAWFVVSLVLSVFSLVKTRARTALFGWSVLGLLGVAYLAYLEVFVINSICVLCTVAHVLGILVFSASFIGLRYSK
jgi:uncharacterized membrane protein